MPRKKKADSSHVTARKWTPPLKGAFLEALRKVRFITQACELAQVPRRTVYDWREADTDFIAAMDEAEACFVDALREKAAKLAMGEDGPTSEDLLKFMLKAKAPEFHEKAAATVNVTFVQLVASRIQGFVQRFIPVSCPKCGHHLEARKDMAQALARMDAIEMTATAVSPE